jgi:hypothetical protein
MPLPSPARRALWLGAAAGLIVVQIAVRGPGQSLLWSTAFDAGHAPLYGLVALAILQWLQSKSGRHAGSRFRWYLLALALTVTAGAGAELIQAVSGGEASPGDAARDAPSCSSWRRCCWPWRSFR